MGLGAQGPGLLLPAEVSAASSAPRLCEGMRGPKTLEPKTVWGALGVPGLLARAQEGGLASSLELAVDRRAPS